MAWYRQRFWMEESCKDSKTRFRLKYAQIGCPHRLTRLLMALLMALTIALLMALTIALCWLSLFALPQLHARPDGFQSDQQ